MPETSATVVQRLHQHLGLRPDELLRTRVDDAIRALGLETNPACAALLAPDTDLWPKFLDLVLVPETWFRRDPGALDAMLAHLGPAPSRPRPLRILSAPCATGEEPLSIALALRDHGWADDDFEIHAVDLREGSVHTAFAGRYRAHAFRGTDMVWRDRHFAPTDDGKGWTLRKPIARSSLRFSRQDVFLLDAATSLCDVLFCRNLFIYLTTPSRQRLLAHLRRLCADDGLLFVGHAEVGLLHEAGLEPLPYPQSFGFRNRSSTPAKERVAPVPLTVTAEPRAQPQPSPTRPGFAVPAASPPVSIGGACEHRRRALAMADRGELNAASRALDACASAPDGCPDAHALRGEFLMASGDLDAARLSLQKALYLRPTHRRALITMVSLAQQRGLAPQHWQERLARSANSGADAAAACTEKIR